MFGSLKSVGRARALSLGTAVMVGLLTTTTLAAALTAFAYDPTRKEVYFNFTADTPLDAFKAVVLKGGMVVGSGVWDPMIPVVSGNGMISGLSPGTSYKLRLMVRWNTGDPWTLQREQPFTTNP